MNGDMLILHQQTSERTIDYKVELQIETEKLFQHHTHTLDKLNRKKLFLNNTFYSLLKRRGGMYACMRVFKGSTKRDCVISMLSSYDRLNDETRRSPLA